MNFHLRLFLFAGCAFSLQAAQAQGLAFGRESVNWNMYSVRQKGTGNTKAFSYVGVNYAVRQSERKFLVMYEAFLDTKQSWVVHNAAKPSLLHHEQQLFALTEVYTRIMRKEVHNFVKANHHDLTYEKLLAEVKRIYKDLNNELFLQQQLYNAQTKNGNDPAMQKRWDERIARDLKDLEKFSETMQWF